MPADLPLWIPVALGLLVLALGLLLGRRWARYRVARRAARSRRLGSRGESLAIRLLERAGFEPIAEQVAGEVEVLVDGRTERFRVRADMLARRGGRSYVVEVKGGEDAARVANRSTRRQLLEYACAFDVDGLLLVDAARKRVQRIVFPALGG